MLKLLKTLHVHIRMRDIGGPYEIDEKLLEKLFCGQNIGLKKISNLDLNMITCDNFCEIYFNAFKETKTPENFCPIHLDPSFVDVDFISKLRFFEGIILLDDFENEQTYLLKRLDFWSLKIMINLIKLHPITYQFYDEIVQKHIYYKTTKVDFNPFIQDVRYESILVSQETISRQEAVRRDRRRKRNKLWKLKEKEDDFRFGEWCSRKYELTKSSGVKVILEVSRYSVPNPIDEFIVKNATFEVFFDEEGYRNDKES
uniref:Ycf1 n=1 Tax=Acrobeloides nanus TaxID=290746 RepID=A0A914D4U6_9BILA